MNRVWIFAAYMLAGPAAAQGVIYKCTVGGVATYSQQPCDGARSKKIKMAPAHKPHADDLLRAREAEERFDAGMRQSELARQESNCIARMTASTQRQTTQRIADYRAKIRELGSYQFYNPGSIATQTAVNGLNQQIGTLQLRIDNEERIAAENLANARTVCAQRRAQADRAL